MRIMTMTWTPERVAELKRLWATGATTAEIGRMLDVSKNAVVGKTHRLGLPGRPSPIKREAIKVPSSPPPPPLMAAPTVVKYHGRPCQWPFGDPGKEDFHFCGAPAIPERPYCDEHCKLAYVRNNRHTRAA